MPLKSINPATGITLAEYGEMGRDEVAAIVRHAITPSGNGAGAQWQSAPCRCAAARILVRKKTGQIQ